MIGDLTPLQQKRRNAILETARRHFSHIGYHDTEMEAIAKDAQVGKGTLYRYFENKQDLYLKTIRFELESLHAFIDDSLKEVDDPVEFVEGMIHCYIDYIEHKENAFDIIILSTTSMLEEVAHVVKSVQSKYHKRFAKRIRAGIDSGVFQDIDPYITLHTLSTGLIYLLFQHTKYGTFSTQDIESSVKKLIVTGLTS
jgi:AcrR family transcriptional regulator